MAIAPETHMGRVDLVVSDLDRSLDYYRRAIGLDLLERNDGEAVLGAGDLELLRLVEEPGARPADGYSGLFHFALLVPRREDLAGWLHHAIRDRVALTGASDHYVSEALYLRDPDHHGIEIYSDRPRELWEGHVDRLGTWPLDIDDLLASRDEPTVELPAGTRMGHVHLRVRDIPETIRFYTETVNLDLMVRLGDQAAFMSAGGYHHHLGANTWESAGAAQAPEGTARLLRYTIVVPGGELPDELQTDPSGNRFVYAVGG
jgi:catechol 2,3-dioxygenase